MIKKLLIISLLAIGLSACNKNSDFVGKPALKPVNTPTVVSEVRATVAYIAVINLSGDTIQSNPVPIVVSN
ncbi:hypothetical protein ACFQZI_18575 [Mucilaginibacter lutimaris]|uniref:Uncharacterized protein n=1 Tax=Mucilaginibacter lutimaris TaxID=931629 RepID=A0ABW2ZKZ5_9SPHI